MTRPSAPTADRTPTGAAGGAGVWSDPVRRAPFTTAGLVLAAWAVDLVGDPTTHHVPLCPFHSVTGLWCPLCGGLRAAWELGHGQVGAALHDNVVFVAALPILFVYWVDWTRRARRGRPRRRVSPPLFVAILVLGAVFWVVRNLPGLEALRPL